MHDTMIERVALAIRKAGNGLDGDTIGTMLRENFRVEPRGDDHGEAELAIVCEAAARAAIEALREPSEAMKQDGEEFGPLDCSSGGEGEPLIYLGRDQAVAVWKTMIDAALTAPASEP